MTMITKFVFVALFAIVHYRVHGNKLGKNQNNESIKSATINHKTDEAMDEDMRDVEEIISKIAKNYTESIEIDILKHEVKLDLKNEYKKDRKNCNEILGEIINLLKKFLMNTHNISQEALDTYEHEQVTYKKERVEFINKAQYLLKNMLHYHNYKKKQLEKEKSEVRKNRTLLEEEEKKLTQNKTKLEDERRKVDEDRAKVRREYYPDAKPVITPGDEKPKPFVSIRFFAYPNPCCYNIKCV